MFFLVLILFTVKSSRVMVINSNDAIIECVDCLSISNQIFSFKEKFNIKVSSEGFLSESFKMDHSIGINKISLKPNLIPVDIIYNQKPINLVVSINNIIYKDYGEIKLAQGEHEFFITADNYLDYKSTENIEFTDSRHQIFLSDFAISKPIKFEISNIKKILIDGLEQTSINALLKNKINKIEIHLENGSVLKREFLVKDNSSLLIRKDFFQEERFFVIDSIPSKASVFSNSNYIGITPLSLEDVSEYDSLIIKKTGFEDQNILISESSASIKNNRISIKLVQSKSEVFFNSEPLSEIFINNESIGQTPQRIYLPVGKHMVSLKKAGYAQIDKEINIYKNTNIEINEKLLTVNEHLISSAPPKYKNNYGIVFKLFYPGKVTIGSKPTEKRRNRNEIIRHVNLNRPFYVATKLINESQYAEINSSQSQSSVLPKNNISWIDAAKTANKLSQIEGFSNFYVFKNNKFIGIDKQSLGYRLITESEWEYINAINDNRTTYPWGNSEIIPEEVGNLAGEEVINIFSLYIENYIDGFEKRSNSDAFLPNSNGIYDLVGNLSEWMHDFYSEDFLLEGKTFNDYLGPRYSSSHVVKGSNYTSSKLKELGVSFRSSQIEASNLIGFRLARYVY